MPAPIQTWKAEAYATHGRFVADLAHDLLATLNPQPGEHILDAGCGDGELTARIAASGANVRGVDLSPAMVAATRARGLEVDHHSLTDLPYTAQFDAIFSNAALHWIARDRQPALLASLHRALRPGGRLVAEMGGQGNIAAIRTGLSAVLAPYGLDPELLAASFYPSATQYRTLLEQAGFKVQTIVILPRPTPLPNGEEGMTIWLNTFRNGVLDQLPPEARDQAVTDTVALLKPILYDDTAHLWTADYIRLRFTATTPA